MEKGVSLRISADLQNLSTIRKFVEEVVKDEQTDPETVGDVVLAVDEAVTNIILHGYQGQPGSLEIQVSKAEDKVTIGLRDQAPPFDPTAYEKKPDLSLPLNQRPLGGMGIYLIRNAVDEITYRVRPQGGNELTLVKKLTGKNNSREEPDEYQH
jgi:serine/threonine-protein kinase RsbW